MEIDSKLTIKETDSIYEVWAKAHQILATTPLNQAIGTYHKAVDCSFCANAVIFLHLEGFPIDEALGRWSWSPLVKEGHCEHIFYSPDGYMEDGALFKELLTMNDVKKESFKTIARHLDEYAEFYFGDEYVEAKEALKS